MGHPDPLQPAVKICLLGDFYIRIGDRRINSRDIPGKKAPALLKLLALQPKYQLVKDQVIDMLWPQLQLREGAAQLYKAIYHIRNAFRSHDGSSFKTTEGLELSEDLLRLSFSGGMTTDIQEFEQTALRGLGLKQLPVLERARKLYTGDLLPMDLYTSWTMDIRDWLRQLYMNVLLTLCSQFRLRHDLLSAATTAHQALATDPLSEEAHQELMMIFALQHQPNRAAIQFKKYKELLWKELEAEASKEITSLAEDIALQRFKPA